MRFSLQVLIVKNPNSVGKYERGGLSWWPNGYDSALHSGGMGLILGQGTKVLHALWWPERIHKIFFIKERGKKYVREMKVPPRMTTKPSRLFSGIASHPGWEWSCHPCWLATSLPLSAVCGAIPGQHVESMSLFMTAPAMTFLRPSTLENLDSCF